MSRESKEETFRTAKSEGECMKHVRGFGYIGNDVDEIADELELDSVELEQGHA